MKAGVSTKYASLDMLQIQAPGKPAPGENELLIKVHATTVNRIDCATIRSRLFLRIMTGLFKLKKKIPGSEFPGKVEAVRQLRFPDVMEMSYGTE